MTPSSESSTSTESFCKRLVRLKDFRGYAKNAGLYLFLIAAPGVFIVEWCPQPIPPLMRAQVYEATDWKLLVEKQYETAAAEISSRISQEHLLFALKLLAVGAVLSLLATDYLSREDEKLVGELLSRSGRQALLFWSATLTAILIDVRIHFNVQRIQELGTWVRELESLVLSNPGMGWENSLLNSDFVTHNVLQRTHLLDRVLLTWVVYGITLFVCLPRKPSYDQKRIALLMVPLSVALFGLVGSYFTANRNSMFLYGTFTFAVSAVCGWVVRCLPLASRSLSPLLPLRRDV